MAAFGRIERRLAAAIVLTALIPLLGAVYLAQKAVRDTSERFFVPEIGVRLDEALGLYQDLARAEKTAMRNEATAIASQGDLAAAVAGHDPAALAGLLAGLLARHPGLVSLSVLEDDRKVASVDRGRPVDEAKELSLEVRRAIGGKADSQGDPGDDGPELVAVFATPRSRYDGMDRMSEFVDTYGKIAARRKQDERAYLLAFSALLGLTIIAAIGIGSTLARGVASRIMRLAEVTRKVGAGDLSTRVEEVGADEVGDLARAFNRMLAEVEATRARIEYLQRIGAWQEMARRLAHEIKNPLTPIQLAVEEIHQRYPGDDPKYRNLLDATLEVVEAEVGTLRRLVGEFSDFARLPQAHLEPGDLAAFLREQAAQSLLSEGGWGGDDEEKPSPRVTVSFELPPGEAPAHLDRQMLRRALINLVRNSAQAIRDQGRAEGRIRVSLTRSGDFHCIDVDDDGPGIPRDSRERIFDPYVTTKHDGTGLGLAIVKKIIVEHGGVISALDGPLGGARVRVTIPADGTAAAEAALDADPSSGRAKAPVAEQTGSTQ
jgi:two-component system, NtrC family, nitrogen regulation sensor histidine kinase NtrY